MADLNLGNVIQDTRSKLIFQLYLVIGYCLRIKNSLLSKENYHRSILVLPPTSPGSLGDEAMENAFLNKLKAKGFQRIGFITLHPSEDWSHLEFVDEFVPFIPFTGNTSKRRLIAFIRELVSYRMLYILGADVMDGAYTEQISLERLEVANYTAQIGMAVAIISFSYNGYPPSRVLNAYKMLHHNVRLVSRDPISQERLQNLTNQEVELSSDIAFLLPSKEDSLLVYNLKKWIFHERSENRIILGVNINPQVLGDTKNEDKVFQLAASYMFLFEELWKETVKYSIVFLPHDFRHNMNDLMLTKKMMAQLPLEIANHCTLPSTPYCTGEAKEICKEIDFILTGRMHLSILGLSVGTPVACITYQGKFEGLFRHFLIENVLITPEQALDHWELKSFFLNCIKRRQELKHQIESILPSIMEFAQINLPPNGNHNKENRADAARLSN